MTMIVGAHLESGRTEESEPRANEALAREMMATTRPPIGNRTARR
jgi:hypothetical protein